MKVSKIIRLFFVFIVFIAFISFISSSCKKDDPSEIYESHIFYNANLEIDGSIVASLELNEEGYYQLEVGNQVSFSVVKNGDIKYSFIVKIDIEDIIDSTSMNIPMIISCDIVDSESPGRIELIVEGDQNEKYISQSGTVYVMRLNQTLFMSNFDLALLNEINGNTITLVGNLEYMLLP